MGIGIFCYYVDYQATDQGYCQKVYDMCFRWHLEQEEFTLDVWL